jgi:hypothetical protein
MSVSAQTVPPATKLTSAEILAIAQRDAEQKYRDLSVYRITLALHPDGWHVDYDIVEPLRTGGGPHYLIDATTGTILQKRYYQ